MSSPLLLKTPRDAVGCGAPIYTSLERSFSNFRHVDHAYCGHNAVRRLFSQARVNGAKTLVVEAIETDGIVQEENEDILSRQTSEK